MFVKHVGFKLRSRAQQVRNSKKSGRRRTQKNLAGEELEKMAGVELQNLAGEDLKKKTGRRETLSKIWQVRSLIKI